MGTEERSTRLGAALLLLGAGCGLVGAYGVLYTGWLSATPAWEGDADGIRAWFTGSVVLGGLGLALGSGGIAVWWRPRS